MVEVRSPNMADYHAEIVLAQVESYWNIRTKQYVAYGTYI